MEFEVVTPKLNATERRKFFLEGNNIQINPSTEPHNETVKEELFKTSGVVSTRE